MKTSLKLIATLFIALSQIGISTAADTSVPAEKSFDAPHQMKIAVKMIGPYAQETDLHLAGTFDIADWTVEAGPAFYDGACKEIQSGFENAEKQVSGRTSYPYGSLKNP